VLLLSFSVADLTGDLLGAPICAADADEEKKPPLPGADQAINVPGDQEEGSKPVHIDDCFCCSRCVDNTISFSFQPNSLPVGQVTGEGLEAVFLLAHRFYRPPRAS